MITPAGRTTTKFSIHDPDGDKNNGGGGGGDESLPRETGVEKSVVKGSGHPTTDAGAFGDLDLKPERMGPPNPPPWGTEKGQFLHSSELENRFRAAVIRPRPIVKFKIGEVHPFTRGHCQLDLTTMTPQERRRIRAKGLKNGNTSLLVSSGAGKGRRSGNIVRICQPTNSKEVYNEKQIRAFNAATDIIEGREVDETSASDAIFSTMTGEQPQLIIPEKMNPEEFARQRREAALKTIARLHAEGRDHPLALQDLHLKFVKRALETARSGKLHRLAIWTSEGTQKEIYHQTLEFQRKFHRKDYLPDRKLNNIVIESIDKFFELHQKHPLLFAYMLGLHEIIPGDHEDEKKRFQPDLTSDVNGPGAGAIIEFLNTSGYTAELEDEGVQWLQFENSEVDADSALHLGSHLQCVAESGFDSSMAVVLWDPDDEGGWPFWAKGRPMFLEDKQFPPGFAEIIEKQKLAEENFFNPNLPIYPINAAFMELRGSERKKLNGVPVGNILPKINMQDRLLDFPGSIFLDRRPDAYVHRKSPRQLVTLGPTVMAMTRRRWQADAKYIAWQRDHGWV